MEVKRKTIKRAIGKNVDVEVLIHDPLIQVYRLSIKEPKLEVYIIIDSGGNVIFLEPLNFSDFTKVE